MRIRWKLIVPLAVLAGAVLGCWWGFSRYVLGERVSYSEELARAQSLGLPLTSEEIERSVAVASGENGAGEYALAIAAKPAGTDQKRLYEITTDLRHGELSDKDLADAGPLLGKYRTFLGHIERGSHFKGADWHRDWDRGPTVLLPELSYLHHGTQLIVLRGILASRAGHLGRAIADVETSLRVSEHLSREPIFWSGLVQMEIQRLACTALQAIARESADRRVRSDCLKIVNRMSAINPKDLVKGNAFMAVRTKALIETEGVEGFLLELGYKQGDEEAAMHLLKFATVRNTLVARMLKQANDLYVAMPSDAANLPAIRRAVKAAEAEFDNGRPDISSVVGRTFMMVSYRGEDLAFGSVIASRRVTAEGIRRLLGMPPSEVTDPFTGKPLLQTRSGSRVTLYSVGENGKDERGKGDDVAFAGL